MRMGALGMSSVRMSSVRMSALRMAYRTRARLGRGMIFYRRLVRHAHISAVKGTPLKEISSSVR
jgi:hypothetical protein